LVYKIEEKPPDFGNAQGNHNGEIRRLMSLNRIGCCWLWHLRHLLRLFLPWGQKSRRSSDSPARLQGSEVLLTFVAKAKALELLALSGFGLPSECAPASAIQPSDALLQLLLMGGILLPPDGVGN
jgi:hypothetical protein